MNIQSFPRILRRQPYIPILRNVGDALTLVSIASEYAVVSGQISTADLASPSILKYESSALGSTRII